MDKYSTRHLYIFSMAIFLIGSIVAAFSPYVYNFNDISYYPSDWCRHPFTIDAVYSIYTVSAEQRGFAMGLAGWLYKVRLQLDQR